MQIWTNASHLDYRYKKWTPATKKLRVSPQIFLQT